MTYYAFFMKNGAHAANAVTQNEIGFVTKPDGTNKVIQFRARCISSSAVMSGSFTLRGHNSSGQDVGLISGNFSTSSSYHFGNLQSFVVSADTETVPKFYYFVFSGFPDGAYEFSIDLVTA